MSVESTLRKFFDRRSATRGDEYFARGRVRRVHRRPKGGIEALVQGEQAYTVTLDDSDDWLIVRCDCPWYTRHEEACKHIWAAIRAASARGLLSDELYGIEVPFDNVVPFAKPARRWEMFLDALEPSTAAPREPRPVPEEIAYVIAPAFGQPLTIRILGRSHRKSGVWGKWKPLALNIDDLQDLDPFDRETIALLHPRPWTSMVEPSISISRGTTAWWVERLARGGKLFLEGDEDELHPIAWDDGPPWTLHAAIVTDAAQESYRIDASIVREGESLPFASIEVIVNDVVITDGRASRFDDRGSASWLQALRSVGPVEIPFADTERFREALLRVPIGNVALPAELGWDVAEARGRPLLSLQADAWSAELFADLFFVYDDWRVSSRSPEMQKTIGRRLIRRDRTREQQYRDRLIAVGAISTSDGYRVRFGQLETIARKLIAEGWSIEIDSAPLRVTDDVDVEITSGIDWFDLEVSATFGETRVVLPELLAAAEGNRTFLRLSDGSVGVVPATWSDALAPVLELGKREGDALRFRSAQALLVDALLESKAHTADAAFDTMRQRIASAAPVPRQEPATLKATLRPYQREGLGWLHFLREAGIGGCLADDMGLGKTVQTLALLEDVRASRSDRPSLVVAPKSLLFNWAAEAAKFAPELRVREHHGTGRVKSADAFNDCDLVLTTYATMRVDIAHLSEIDFEYVVLDEAQAIKNASSHVAKASRLLRGRHRLALSGTPIENHLGELWSLFEFLNPGLLASARSFQRTFAAKSVPPERREALARALRPFILRRTKEQVAPELPERTEQTLYCELEGEQKKHYDELRDHYRSALLGRIRKGGIDKSRMQILEALLRLRQAACHPALIDPNADDESAKTELLMDELRDVLDSGHRALVFSQFTSFLAIVRRELDKEKVPYLYLDGQTRDRQSLVEQFQSENGPPLFLISLKAGGLGLNLTNADYIFLLDPWWNPAVEAQAIDRAHRIGRVRPVVAYRLIARDTVEEKILELQARKRELAESIISEDNSVLRKLEVEDLELLLS